MAQNETIILKKTVRLGATEKEGSVFCRIELVEREEGKPRLSICGVIGPLVSGNARGSCGQIEQPPIEKPAPGWNQTSIAEFFNVWRRWHLNDMRPACEHQRKRGETYQTHPSASCPDCGYSLGSAWLYEAIPDHIVKYLTNLPETDRTPAWV